MRVPRRAQRELNPPRSGTMAEVTYYVALPFVAADDDGIAAGEPTEFSRRAKGFSERPLAWHKSNNLAQN